MSAPQFTPGPLKAVGREVWVVRDGIEAGMLCRSVPETPTGSTYEQSPDEVIANAHLFAAASELLEAGQALYDALGKWTKHEQGWFTPEVIAAGGRWNKAAAKARGDA